MVKRQHEARSDAVAFKKSRTAFKSLEENRSNPGVAERDRRDRLALKALKVSGLVLLAQYRMTIDALPFDFVLLSLCSLITVE